METIKNYIENMFLGYPKTEKIEKIKNDLLSNMEDKYNELKKSGKTENEAIGIVISEFGNIDEILNEVGIKVEDNSSEKIYVSENEVNAYLESRIAMGKKYFNRSFTMYTWSSTTCLYHTVSRSVI